GSEDVDIPPLQGEAESNGLDDIGFVIDDQDPHHASSGGPAAGTGTGNGPPRPGRLRTSIVPPCACAIASARGRPRPTPSWGAFGSCRPTKNRSNRCAWSTAEIPGPSSFTDQRTMPSFGPCTRTVMRPPSGAKG